MQAILPFNAARAAKWRDLVPFAVFLHGADLVDSKAIGLLFERHGPRVYRRALRMLGNTADAEEATQEIFIRVVRGADRFQDRSQVTTWLYQITTNYCLNFMRDRGRHAAVYEKHIAPQAEQAAEFGSSRPDDVAHIRTLIARAPEREAAAAIYVYLDGMSHEEAAEVLGVSKRTVGNLLERFQQWMDSQETAKTGSDT